MLAEQMFVDAGNKSVVFVTHSTASRLFYYFLSQQTPEWKAKYVARWISSAGAFGGDVVTLGTLSAGVEDGQQSALSHNNVRRLFRSFSDCTFGSPDPLVFQDAVIFEFKGQGYTASQLADIFRIIGHEDGVKHLNRTSALITSLADPGVRVTCLRSVGTQTAEKFVYKDEKSLLDDATIVRGDGDGNLNSVSAAVCEDWSQSPGFESVVYDGIKHVDMIRDARVVKQILKTVSAVNAQQ